MNKKLMRVAGITWSTIDVATTLGLAALTVVLLWPVLTKARVEPGPNSKARAGSAKRPEPPLPTEPIALGTTGLKGDARARVAIVAYSDFECPFCGRFAKEVFPALDKKYIASGAILFAFRHLPLENIHPLALQAAESVECAGRQGRFWQMHDLQFANPKELALADHLERAQELGLDGRAFERCLDGEMTSLVRTQQSEARAAGVRSTPTFLIGTVTTDGLRVSDRLVGAKSLDQFAAVLDRLLDQSPPR